ncbi:MAG: ribosome small subunit-dependent GTPase A [Clostridia bacterium]|nr:ribosome small subunit-dependent GTPase A [Clostridia bacterium]
MLKGTIVKGVGGTYSVYADGGILECSARGVFRKQEIRPVVGDCVIVDEGKRLLKEILPRQNCLVRPNVSNIDQLLIVCSAVNPKPDLRLIDKLSVIASAADIDVGICVNKTDIDTHGAAEELFDIYKTVPYNVYLTSVSDNEGIDELMYALYGKTTAFAGLSGVGKSSILSIVTGGVLETGATSKIERGRHTTRHVELMKITGSKGGFVFDTPGFSQLEIEKIPARDLWQYFPEISRRAGQCRFSDCAHVGEKGCKIEDDLKKGLVAQSRYESYLEFYNILKTVKEWER